MNALTTNPVSFIPLALPLSGGRRNTTPLLASAREEEPLGVRDPRIGVHVPRFSVLEAVSFDYFTSGLRCLLEVSFPAKILVRGSRAEDA